MADRKEDEVNTINMPAAEKTMTAKPNVVTRYLREVQFELKKTNWPSYNELTKSTIVVLATIAVVAVYLFICDIIVQKIAEVVFGAVSK